MLGRRTSTFIVFFLALLPRSAVAQTPSAPKSKQESRNQASRLGVLSSIQGLLEAHKGDVAVSIRNLKTDQQFSHNAEVAMPTASLIKLPMMVATYRMADAGKLDLSKPIELKEADKVPGSGVLTEHFSKGISLPLVDYIRLMIRYSDNTATNIVADQIGLKATAATMEQLGCENTKLHSKVYRGDTTVFPERSREFGIGSTTANEMVKVLSMLHAGKLANKASTEAMLAHLLTCEDDSKLAALLPKQTKFMHKTGAIANCRTDAGIIETPNGPIAVCFLSNKNEDQSWTDENEANVLAGKIGQLIVEQFGSPDVDTRLREGAFGKLVETLQRTLNVRLRPPGGLSIDGDFGPATRSAVERFQRQEKLSETGIADVATWKALGTLVEEDGPVASPETVNSEKLPKLPQADLSNPPAVTCKAWAIADQATGELLFSNNADAVLEAASTTKIMTAHVVLQLCEANPEWLRSDVTISKRADETVGSSARLSVGEKVTVLELLHGLMLPSGNDASVALAEHFGALLKAGKESEKPDASRSYERFIQAMNETAKELGMAKANYTNTHGLPNDAHVISASGLSKLAVAAMKNQHFREIVAKRQFGCVVRSKEGYQRNIVWKNSNKLLGVEGYSGVKTGTTNAAGACLVTAAVRDGDRLIAVVLGSSSSPARFADTENLLRWAWKKRVSK